MRYKLTPAPAIIARVGSLRSFQQSKADIVRTDCEKIRVAHREYSRLIEAVFLIVQMSEFGIGLLEVLYYLPLAFVVLFLFVQVVVRLVRRFYHFPIPSFLAGLVDNPVRRRIQSPKKIADRLDLRPDMRVVEIGPGPGTFTMEVGARVAPGGSVYAFDIFPKTIRKLLARIVKKEATNIAPVVASAYDLPLTSRSADRVFMVSVLAEIPDRKRALHEFERVLKRDGLLSVSEFLSDPDYPLRRTVIRWCYEAGFREISKHGSLVEYTLSFRLA